MQCCAAATTATTAGAAERRWRRPRNNITTDDSGSSPDIDISILSKTYFRSDDGTQKNQEKLNPV